jgi:HAD superfamily hydrolase (TIGR01509 family)
MSAPSVLVFDLGNVLVFHHEQNFFAKLAAACRPGAPSEQLFSAAAEREDVGRGGDFARVYAALVAEAGLTMDFPAFRLAYDDIFTANPPMVEFVHTLPRPRVLLSNTCETHVAWIRDRFPDVLPLFDQCVLSNEVGLLKPDLAIYRHVESVTGRAPEAHLFFDDRADNVQAAQAAGWQGVIFEGVEQCRRELAARGIGVAGEAPAR